MVTFFLSSFFISTQSSRTVSDFLTPHNIIRSQYHLKPLQWDAKLASYARWYANQRRGDCQLIYSNSNYGENIFWGKGKRWKPADAVAAWFAERSPYDYNRINCNSKDCLHFTQLVWRTTLRVGCAKIICTSGDTYITCNYDPHGNIIGQRPYWLQFL
ncbi:hypothetical protein IFM89_023760 [Coptis chinensis]|uniref:SCP domain-containing protein n=1 Tax=Coptis chinensis TaxID=261450 RepID=A0A835H0B4_9MAGN|nr:hypothetical protein IFM89_023760 [Coptis chinensis]